MDYVLQLIAMALSKDAVYGIVQGPRMATIQWQLTAGQIQCLNLCASVNKFVMVLIKLWFEVYQARYGIH